MNKHQFLNVWLVALALGIVAMAAACGGDGEGGKLAPTAPAGSYRVKIQAELVGQAAEAVVCGVSPLETEDCEPNELDIEGEGEFIAPDRLHGTLRLKQLDASFEVVLIEGSLFIRAGDGEWMEDEDAGEELADGILAFFNLPLTLGCDMQATPEKVGGTRAQHCLLDGSSAESVASMFGAGGYVNFTSSSVEFWADEEKAWPVRLLVQLAGRAESTFSVGVQLDIRDVNDPGIKIEAPEVEAVPTNTPVPTNTARPTPKTTPTRGPTATPTVAPELSPEEQAQFEALINKHRDIWIESHRTRDGSRLAEIYTGRELERQQKEIGDLKSSYTNEYYVSERLDFKLLSARRTGPNEVVVRTQERWRIVAFAASSGKEKGTDEQLLEETYYFQRVVNNWLLEWRDVIRPPQ